MLEWLLIVVVVGGLIAAGAWLARGYLFGDGASGGGLFGAAKERRIGVSDQVSIDGKRRLMLIFRDGVEHLIMTGGPVDMVIEQNIQPGRLRQSYERATMGAEAPGLEPQPAAFGRVRPRGPAQATPLDQQGG